VDAVNDLLILIDSYLGSAVWFPFLLLSVGIFFTLYLGFPQIRYFKHAIGITTGRFDKDGAKGDTSHFQALATALSGTVGTGNIGGVALALHLGGPAALFWMWVTAFFGMTSKFVEVTLSHKYREQTADGTMAGGPMYYMEKGMNAKWLAVIFAMATVLSSFGTGSLPQINSIAAGLQSTFNIEPIVTGTVLAVLLALVIIGGIKRIAAVAATIVPTMAMIYLVGAFAVILPNLGNIGPSFVAIFSDAFTGSAATGGFLGATFAYVFDRGVNRGLYSNEAGQGSAPIAHASARTDEPADEGMVSILEPFIDTIVICTITGLVILSSGAWKEKFDNEFQRADMRFVAGAYSEQEPEDVAQMFALLNGDETTASLYSGELIISDGRALNSQDFTLMASRSFAEEIVFARDDVPLSGTLRVTEGRLDDADVEVSGMSLIHSVPLTTVAFTRGYFGDYGQYVVSIGR
jgi:AGCS family alanine or glycine:cation symporter